MRRGKKMLRCTHSFTARVGDEEQEFRAGESYVSPDAEVLDYFPDYFAPAVELIGRDNAVTYSAMERGFDGISTRDIADFDRLSDDEKRDRKRALIRALEDPEGHLEDGVSLRGMKRPDRTQQQSGPEGSPRRSLRDALATLDRHVQRNELSNSAATNVEEVLNRDTELGVDAAYIAAAGSDDYRTAFAKLLRHGEAHAQYHMTPQEHEAVRTLTRAESMRGMVSGTGASGGFGLPITVDPTIQLSSNGAKNPIRQLATVRTMTTRELRVVTSDGTAASYDAEASEVSDDTPTLVQPILTAQMARYFVPFSFELDQDWANIEAQLQTLVANAKDELENTKFLLGAGSGSNEPVGLLAVGTTGSLTTTQRVLTAGTATFAAADVYALKQAVPARWMGTAQWAAHPTTVDTAWQFVATGSTTQAVLMENRQSILGRRVDEWSAMFASGTTPATGSKIALYGDFKAAFTIGDRLGVSVSLIPHLFGASQRPTGQKGLFAYWRNDSRVVVPNAIRYLEAK